MPKTSFRTFWASYWPNLLGYFLCCASAIPLALAYQWLTGEEFPLPWITTIKGRSNPFPLLWGALLWFGWFQRYARRS